MAISSAETVDRERASADTPAVAALKKNKSVIDQTLSLLSSVRFGLVMLMLLLVCCMIGMLVMQQNVDGFRQYYIRLTPAQRSLYGSLGLFDIYHSWYFTGLLAVISLNIILSSIDRFPEAWRYIRKPKLGASPSFIRAQKFNKVIETHSSPEDFAKNAAAVWSKAGLRPRSTREDGRITIFAQRNAWNRMGAYAVHVALLMIFIGGFLTSRYGIGGSMEIAPGHSSKSFNTFETRLEGGQSGSASLPFTVECTDLRQELIRAEGGLDVMNTIDWLSFVNIKDGDQTMSALIHLNAPFDYRGYRFFQSSFQPQGYARQITVSLKLTNGELREVTIERDGSVDVEGIGTVSFLNFYPDFTLEGGTADTASGDYNNPVAELQITAPDSKPRREFAFNAQMLSQSPHASDRSGNDSGARDRILLKNFEKVALSHTLTIQYDPGRTLVYAGFLLLTVSLCAVFFFSHQRVWGVVEANGKRSTLYFGGNTNRNGTAFEGRFNSLVQSAVGGSSKQ